MGEVLDRVSWLAERRTGIGGSDVAAILGLSPYRSAVDVFLDKRGEIPEQPENDAMYFGKVLEPIVRQEYANRTGETVLLPTGMLRHPKREFMLANLDGFTESGRLFEAKTARTSEGWGEPGSDEVPQGYLFQVQHYMAITGYAVTDVAVLIGGSDFRIYSVEADAELHDMMVDAEAEFWRRVQLNDCPEPVSIEDAKLLWGRFSNARNVVATPEIAGAVERLREIKEALAVLGDEEEAEKLAIMVALELVPVEQVDRDAAARHVRNMVGLSDIAERMECGEMDDNFVVQNYARHRIAAIEAQASRIAELEAGLRAIGTFKCDDPAGAFYTVRLRARVLLGDREG